jgi:pimeloyl-ACP methyl ester carboxylesterase
VITGHVIAQPEQTRPYEQPVPRPQAVRPGPLSSRAAGLNNDARVAALLTRYDLENVRVPTLIIALQDDLYGMFAGAQYTAEHIPGAKFVTYDRGGHLWIGHQDEVMDALASFARQCMQAASSETRDGR